MWRKEAKTIKRRDKSKPGGTRKRNSSTNGVVSAGLFFFFTMGHREGQKTCLCRGQRGRRGERDFRNLGGQSVFKACQRRGGGGGTSRPPKDDYFGNHEKKTQNQWIRTRVPARQGWRGIVEGGRVPGLEGG